MQCRNPKLVHEPEVQELARIGMSHGHLHIQGRMLISTQVFDLTRWDGLLIPSNSCRICSKPIPKLLVLLKNVAVTGAFAGTSNPTHL